MQNKTAKLFKQAMQHEAAGELDQALSVFLEANAAGGKTGAEAALGAGRVCNRLGRFRDALGWLVKAWGETEHSDAVPPETKARILAEIGTAQAGLGERAKAIQSWQASLALHRTSEAAKQLAAAQAGSEEERLLAVLHDGIRAQQGRNFRTAEECFKEVLSWHPKHAQATHLLGLVCYQTGRLDEAKQLLEKSLALQPNSAEFCNNYGMFHWEKGDPTLAVRFFQRATQINPVFPQAFNNLGLAYKKLGTLLQAEEAFRAALKLNESFAEAMINLGLTRHAQGDSAEALTLLKQALALQPRFTALTETIKKLEGEKTASRRKPAATPKGRSTGKAKTGAKGTSTAKPAAATKPKASKSPAPKGGKATAPAQAENKKGKVGAAKKPAPPTLAAKTTKSSAKTRK
ncbi:MAG: tetratricopeptide repeat protein [Thermodesulfobacteriota bacterium]